MPTAAILKSRARVGLKGERLEIVRLDDDAEGAETLREIPIRDLDRVVLAEHVQITGQAMSALLRAGIPVSYLGWSGQYLGGFVPAMTDHGQARLRQYQRTLDPAFALAMAGRIVVAKLYNQRRVLQRLAASRFGEKTSDLPSREASGDNPAAPDRKDLQRPEDQAGLERRKIHVKDALTWLDGLFAPIRTATTLDELRGYEGASTARYFQTWSLFLPPEFPFERRSTRPPHNPVNACISFGATLLYNEAVAFVHARGLDPALGLLHATEDGRWSLALDLMEPFRPVLVEALALDLFSHQILQATHFEPSHGGIYLNEDGRRRFLLQYERRMERQFMSESVGHRTTLRQQLDEQAAMFKAALEDPARFEPFLIN